MKKLIGLLLVCCLFGLAALLNNCGGSGTVTTTTTTTTTSFPTGNLTLSGGINFANTNDGLRGGVAVTLSTANASISTTTGSSGTYAFNNIAAGTYTLSATKLGWTITGESVTLTTSNAAKSLPAYPTFWEILRVGDGKTLNSIAFSPISKPSFSATNWSSLRTF